MTFGGFTVHRARLANMVNYSSVDWLAQSCYSSSTCATETHGAGAHSQTSRRPHIPCMVQPAPPTLGKSHLQTKSSKPTEQQHRETGKDRGSCSSSSNCASPNSKTSDYSSGDENKPAFLPSDLSVEKVGVHVRRGRTKFTDEQVAKLEKIFRKYKYVDLVRRVKTAKKLGLKETQVRTWFQNRRMRMKRAMQETMDFQMSQRSIRGMVPVQFLNRQYGPTERMLYCQQMSMWPQLLQLPQLYYKTAP